VNYPGDTDLQGSGPADAAFVVSLALTAPPLPNPVFNAAYTTTISTGVSGTAPVSFSETGALPAGVTLLTTGAFSGTPTNAAQIGKSFPITVHATDANGATGSQAYTLTLGSPCGAGLTTDVLTATSASGNFMGDLLCERSGDRDLHPGNSPRHRHGEHLVGGHPDHRLRHQPGPHRPSSGDHQSLHRNGAGPGQGGDVYAVVAGAGGRAPTRR
jgi:hypothetical protein